MTGKRKKDIARIVLAVCCVLLLVPGEMFSMAGVQPEDDPLMQGRLGSTSGQEVIRNAEFVWEGGGPLRLFADDMAPATAAHYEHMGIDNYYGGAIPSSGQAAEAWRHEPFRYGIEDPMNSNAWRLADPSSSNGAWHYGGEDEAGLHYQRIGDEASVITPVIDLRSVPRIDESRSVMMDTGVLSRVVTDTVCGLVFVLSEEACRLGHTEDVRLELDEAFAALRVRHAYDFHHQGDELTDGARVEFSIQDPVTGWSSWNPLEPVDDKLRIGDEEVQARKVAPTEDGFDIKTRLAWELEVDRDEILDRDNATNHLPDPDNPTSIPDLEGLAEEIPDPEQVVHVETDAEGNITYTEDGADGPRHGTYAEVSRNETGVPLIETGEFEENRPPPWRYQGVLAASGWRGFGGHSDGLVDSVFDLSEAAGHLVRLRFVTTTEEPTTPEAARLPFGGWLVDAFQVTGIGEPGLDIIDLPTPGDGAILPPDQKTGFPVEAMIHNKASEPTRAHVVFDFNDQITTSTTVPLGAGTTARGLASTPETLEQLLPAPREGLQRVSVSATPRAETLDVPGGSSLPEGITTEAGFHFLFGHGGGPDGSFWDALDLEIQPEGEWNGGPILRGQSVEISATLRNLGSTPTNIQLDENGLHPVVRDVRGNKVGIGVVTGSDGNEITLPVSRDISRSLGEPGGERVVNWTWAGSDVAQVVEFFLESADGEVIIEGPRLLVETVEPPAATLNPANPWNIGDNDPEHAFSNDCVRFREWENRRGVLRCGAEDTLASPVSAITSAELRRGPQMTLEVVHQGGPFTVKAHHNSSIPNPMFTRSPVEDEWEEPFATFETDGNDNEWTVSDWSVTLPDDCTEAGRSGCWMFLTFESDSEEFWRIEEIQLAVENISIMWETFRVAMEPQETAIHARSEEGLLWLHGRDGWSENITGEGPINNNPSIQDGDVELSPQAFVSEEPRYYPTGRVVEDSVFETGPIGLGGGRPTLVFDHWYDLGTGGRASVEVAPSINGEPGPWETIAEYQGSLNQPPVMQNIRMKLWDRAGDTVYLRFHYTIDPNADLFWEGSGWFLEALHLNQHFTDGQEDHSLMPGAESPENGLENAEKLEEFQPGLDTGATVSRNLASPEAHLEFSVDMSPCATRGAPNRYGRGPAIVTDPIDLRAAHEPVLTLEHYGDIHHRSRQRIGFDIEYQTALPDGTWPSEWKRATPHDFVAGQGGGPPEPIVLQGHDGHAVTWLQRPGGGPVGSPFYEWTVNVTGPDNPWRNEFDLNSLTGATVRFRLHAWSYLEERFGGAVGNFRIQCLTGLDWTISEFSIAESRHFVDVAVNEIHLDRDDSEAVRRTDPAALSGIGDATVVSNDEFNAFVKFSNDGVIPFNQVRVRMDADSLEGGGSKDGLSIIAVDPDGRPTNTNQGLSRDLQAGDETEMRFFIDASRAAPGLYQLTATAEPVDAQDTNPASAIQRTLLVVAPYRQLGLDDRESVVAPFAAVPMERRTVDVSVTNRGNVDEANVNLRAEIVKRIGLTKAEPVEIVDDPFDERQISLARRGGIAEVSWTLRPENLVDETGAPVLEPGGAYAIRVTLEPREDSVRSWWKDTNVDLIPGTDAARMGSEFVDLSQSGEFIIPFLVEDAVFRDDLGGKNGTSLIEEGFPFDTREKWTAMTNVDGETLTGEDRPWVPRWAFEPVDRVGVEGRATGNAWFIPPYEGVENVEHVLISPPLPSHVVDAASRAILDMQYAHDLAEGQAVLEYRSLQWDDEASDWVPRQGIESGWRPVDSTRAERIAVVLPPDFPRVTGTWIEPSYPIHLTFDDERRYCEDYDRTRPMGGREQPGCSYSPRDTAGMHPVPPFYEEDGTGWWARECQEPANEYGFCAWSPFPAQNGGDPEWARALEDGLRLLAQSLGPENIRVFTELGDDFGIDTKDDMWLEVPQDEDGDLVYEFAVGNLDELGVRLDSYGGILLMGDNATTVHAAQSDHLRRMAQADTDAYNISQGLSPGTPEREFHDKLHEILRGAQDSGIRILGGIGPASGSLALSGAAEGQKLAVWQTPDEDSPGNPAPPLTFHDGQIRCLVENRPHNPIQDYGDGFIDALGVQPWEMCEYTINRLDGVPDTVGIARENRFNYYYFSPQDARSLALQDFLARGGAEMVNQPHDPVQVSKADPSAPTFITAAHAENVEDWIKRIVEETTKVSGRLPTGSGSWEPLPPQLAFYYAGSFESGPDGEDRFIGNPSQFRLRIQADPDLGGHGFFALDRIGLLGSPTEKDLSVEFVEPRDGRSYAPGEPFNIELEITNRGLREIQRGAAIGEVVVEQSGLCTVNGGATCESPETPWSTQFTVPALPPGAQSTIRLDESMCQQSGGCPFGNGRFPDRENPDRTPPSIFEFGVELLNFDDDDPLNNQAKATARGLLETDVQIEHLKILPSQAPFEKILDTGFDVEIGLSNSGTQQEEIFLVTRLERALPSDCYDPGNPDGDPAVDPSGPYRACDPNMERPSRVVPLENTRHHVGRDQILKTTVADVMIGDHDVTPGAWLVVVEARMAEAGRLVTHDRAVQWINFGDTPPESKSSWAYRHLGLENEFPDLEVSVSMTETHGVDDFRADWQVPPPGHDIAVEGGAPVVDGERHRGKYGESPGTTDGDTVLSHGWSLLEPAENRIFDGPLLEWTRSGNPSVPASEIGQRYCTGCSDDPDERSRTGLANRGIDDFGPDWIVWQPEHGKNGPPLSLAGYEKPVLRMVTNYEATANTAYIVEAQVPKRVCSNPGNVGNPDAPDRHIECAWDWHWGDASTEAGVRGSAEWVTLTGAHTKNPPDGLRTGPRCGGGGQDAGHCWRDPTNPLATRSGIWGDSTTGEHADAQGWQVVEYDLTELLGPEGILHEHCVDARSTGDTPTNRNFLRSAAGGAPPQLYFPAEHMPQRLNNPQDDPCRYAWSNGYWSEDDKEGDPIPRPIRFRFTAASFGGDEGINRWQIADVALSDHRLQFEQGTQKLRMKDNEAKIVPFRITNTGRVSDEIMVSWDHPAGYSPPQDVHVTIGHSPVGPFEDEITINVPAHSTVPVYVRTEVGLGHGLTPGQRVNIPVMLEAQSIRDPTALALGLVEGSFTAQAWGDLDVRCLMIGNDDECLRLAQVSVGVPVSVTAAWLNDGEVPIGNETDPILIRLVEERIEEGRVVSSRVARAADGTLAQRLWHDPIAPTRTAEHVTLEWNPPEEGHYRLTGEVNLPGEDDAIVRLPESDYDNNRFTREVIVGAVPLSDLRIRDAWLESFHTGERAERLIDGHLYVVNADIVNQGRADARDFAAEFRVGAADPFSRAAKDRFHGEHNQEVLTSTPWQARLRADGASEWAFAVDVSTVTPEATVEGKTFSWDVSVDSFKLGITDAPTSITIAPGQEVHVPINLTNTGNAPATPNARLQASTSGVEVHLAGSSRLEVGETSEEMLVLVADNSLVEGETLPGIILGVREDPLREVPLGIDLIVSGKSPVHAVAQPFTAVPGVAQMPLGITSDGNTDTRWRIVEASFPLAVETWRVELAPFQTERVDANIRVLNGTLPGGYQSEVTLEVETDDLVRRINVPVRVQVDPEARFEAHASPADQTVPLGRPGTIMVELRNTGNVPVQAGVNHTMDDGIIGGKSPESSRDPLEPGRTRVHEIQVSAPQGVRQVLGTSNVTWEWPAGNTSGAQGLDWRVEYEPRQVRIVSSSLEGLVATSGQRNGVSVTIENPSTTPVDAEVLVLIDGTVHGIEETWLGPQARGTVQVDFRPGEEGEDHDIMVIARPAGSTVGPSDPLFFEIADASSRHLTVEPALESQFTPGLPLGFLLVVGLLFVPILRESRISQGTKCDEGHRTNRRTHPQPNLSQ